ncbi:MAG: 5-amino-6-(D-ribitylamino)uracil--L-tyrosine 4-hydroxyphenyl transferase CofH [Candidatus Heimdallarchaeota archaeon]|nr:5-amino-6-(D-ribitylamino)uracil--L-tyrosine 4-hydroxyphenyl transferase CofH [Candidatus Heimdallarchaeota archaeon]
MLKKRGKELWIQTSVADELRTQQSGDEVTFIVNQNINFTQYCIGSCRFCSYSIKPETSKSKISRMSLEEIQIETEKAVARNCTEICIQGGLDTELNYEFYVDILKTIKSVSSNIHIHGFSPSEIAFMSQISGETVEDIFKDLKKEGLDSFPGTAAEILVDDVRRKICPEKISTKQWANIVLTGHSLGLRSTATMMYGHIETYLEEAEHLAILKHIQQISNGFTEFIPLSFVYPNTKLYRYMGARPSSTGMHDLALFSTARLYLGESFSNIQASWVKLGPKLAQVSLNAGVNDLGGTLFTENITKSAGGSFGEEKSTEEFIDLIRDAERIPVRRDTLYNKLQIF